MDRQEFVEKLQAALNGRIAPSKVAETAEYYRDYISVEIRKGRSEAEVMESLGDPRLIARTIIQTSSSDATGGRGGTGSGEAYREAYQESYGEYGEPNEQESGYVYRTGTTGTRIPAWLLTILVIVGVIIVLTLVFSVLSFLAPIILVVAAVLFMVKLFRDWLN